MAEPHVVSALVAKRSEVAGLIADLERKAAQQRADLVHVDAVLGLYAPELEPDCIPSRAARRRNGWFKHVLTKAGVGRTGSDGAGHAASCAGSPANQGDRRRGDEIARPGSGRYADHPSDLQAGEQRPCAAGG